MNLLENLDQIILNLNLLINDVWKLVLFETSIQDNSFLVIIWSMVFYFVVLFISIYVLKIILEGIFKFIFNPITFIFIILIFGLSVWTIIQINNDYEFIATLEDSKNDLSTTPKVNLEKINPLTNNLEDDQKLSNALKQIEKLKEEIKKQSQVIQELKSN
tara:strand:- start:1019 stop:1498 length:480 start_codon:yes stop_codon:yes gene_type:complete